MNDDHVSQIDLARTIHLPGSDWRACVAIGPDGSETLWLVSPTPNQTPGCACHTCAPHDQDTTPHRQREQMT
jgi:hypothetical protein